MSPSLSAALLLHASRIQFSTGYSGYCATECMHRVFMFILLRWFHLWLLSCARQYVLTNGELNQKKIADCLEFL
jgi:hypothetical protein